MPQAVPGQFCKLAATQVAAEQNGQNRSITLFGRRVTARAPTDILGLEVKSQSDLTCAVAGVLRRLRGAEDAEGRCVIDLRRGGRKVGVVENVGEGGFEAQRRALGQGKGLGESE